MSAPPARGEDGPAGDVVSSVVGRGRAFFEEVAARHGAETADQVFLASLPVDERIRLLEHRNALIEARMRGLRGG